VKWAEFMPHVLPFVPSCPEQLAIDHVIEAARTFCTRTKAWSVEPDVLLTTAGIDTYPLALEDETERVQLMGAWLDGHALGILSAQRGRALRATRYQGCSRTAQLDGTQDVRITPAPDRGDLELVLDIAVRPTINATEWPDDLAEHVKAIATGAIGTLAWIPKQPFSDRQVATDYTQMFAGRCQSVMLDVARNYSTRDGWSRRTTRFV
jgi:hypothetical protein